MYHRSKLGLSHIKYSILISQHMVLSAKTYPLLARGMMVLPLLSIKADIHSPNISILCGGFQLLHRCSDAKREKSKGNEHITDIAVLIVFCKYTVMVYSSMVKLE